MKTYIIKMIWKYIALVLAPLCIVSCTKTDYDTRQFYTTYNGKYVTFWHDYIIFEKYEGKEPPKDNYIKLYHKSPYKGFVHVCFKKDNSIIIHRENHDSVACGFDNNKYQVETLYGWENRLNYYDRCSMEDSLIIADYSINEYRGVLYPTFFEVVGDSVYAANYRDKGFRITQRFDTVFSIHDEILRTRDPY